MNAKATDMQMWVNRMDLTAYETEAGHQVALKVREHSLAVGAFVTRYGRDEVLQEAAELYLLLVEELTNDSQIRMEALDYALHWAENRTRDKVQAIQLQGEFLKMIYNNVIANRKVAA